MEINIKDGVSLANLKATTFRAIFATAEILSNKNLITTITSTDEVLPHRLKNSFHYTGDAFDFRIRRIPVCFRQNIVNKLQKKLLEIDKRFQVVLKENHIHVELDWRN